MASHTQSTQPKVARQLRLLADRAALSSMIMIEGRVAGVSGMMVEIDGIAGHSTIGDRVSLQTSSGRAAEAEVVGFRGSLARALTFGTLDGIGPGSSASLPVSAGQITGGRGRSCGPAQPGSAGCWTPWDSRWMARDPFPPALSGPSAPWRQRRRAGPGSDPGLTSEYGRSTCSRPVARAKDWACSPGPGSGSQPCCPCSPAKLDAMWR